MRLMKVSPLDSQIFFDDSIRNIASGKAAGLHTVVVSSKDFPSIKSIHDSHSITIVPLPNQLVKKCRWEDLH